MNKFTFHVSCFVSRFTLALAAAAFIALAPPARAQYQPNFYQNVLTNGTTWCVSNNATLSTTTLTCRPVTVLQGKGLAVLPYFVGTNANAANFILDAEVTADGTNYTTTQPFKLTNSLNSTTAVRPVNFITKDQLDNVRYIKFTQVRCAHTNTVILTNIVVSYSNGP